MNHLQHDLRFNIYLLAVALKQDVSSGAKLGFGINAVPLKQTDVFLVHEVGQAVGGAGVV